METTQDDERDSTNTTDAAANPVEVSETGKPVRILVLYYSQSGDVHRSIESFIKPLRKPGVTLRIAPILPQETYPFPWKNVFRFFSILPECVVGDPPEITEPNWPEDERFDLIILGYQVWFLSPSLPVQGFFNCGHSKVLNGTKVITLTVSRNMWHSASETMKRLLAKAGAVHVDNVAVVHQGPAWATFLTTTRLLIFGKRDRLLGIFPPAGILEEDFQVVERLGTAVSEQLDRVHEPDSQPFLRDRNAAPINRHYLLPEFIGWYLFSAWAHLLRFLGRGAKWLRAIGLLCFVPFLVGMIVIGIPLVIIGRLLFYPLVNKFVQSHEARLKEPSG